VPGGLAYLAAGLAIVGSWLRNPEKGSGTFSGGALPRRAGRGGP
jgi:hypothetical protein